MRLIVLAAAVLGGHGLLCLGGCDTAVPEHGVNRAMAQLFASGRWSEARVSADGPAGPCAPFLAAPLGQYCPQVMAAGLASQTRQRTWQRSASSWGEQDKALWFLSTASERSRSVPLLETRLDGEDHSPSRWNDLAAAYFNDRRSNTDWRAFEAALTAVDRSLALAPEDPRALYNQALFLETLGAVEAAVEAWRAYLEHARRADWRSLGERRLRRLGDAQQAALRVHDAVGSQASDTFELGDGADRAMQRLSRSALASDLLDNGKLLHDLGADTGGFCETPGRAAQLGAAGELPGGIGGPSLLGDTISWLCGEDTLARGQAVAQLAEAIAAYDDGKRAKAQAFASAVHPALVEANSPLAGVARLLEGQSRFAQEHYKDPVRLALMQYALEDASHSPYAAVAARAFERLGSLALRRGLTEEAVSAYSAGERLLESGQDAAQLARIQALNATALASFGRHDAASHTLLTALRGAREAALPDGTVATLCILGASVSTLAQAPHLREVLADCAVRKLPPQAGATARVEAYAARGAAREYLGRHARAQADFDLAHEAVGLTQERNEATLNDIFVAFQYGLAKAETDPVQAIAPLQKAAEFYATGGNISIESFARQALIKAYDALGEVAQADGETDLLVQRFQSVPDAEGAAVRRWRYQHQRTVYERRVRALVQAGDHRQALAVLVGARQPLRFGEASVRDIIEAATPQGGGSQQEEVTLIFAWLEDTIVSWRINREGQLAFYEAPPRAEGKASWLALVARAANAGAAPLPGGRDGALTQLYDALLRPATADLPPDARLHLLPDGPLFGLPWPALRDRESQRYLVQQFQVDVAVELRSQGTGQHRAQEPWERIEVFADPSADATLSLPSVADDARVISAAFAGAGVWHHEGEALTRAQFEQALQMADLVHYSGHATVDIVDPSRSRLVMRRDETGAVLDAVTASDLDRLVPPGDAAAKLVVLAACDTAAYSDRLPHALAVVRPLLELGVREVMGALRPIDDGEYHTLMTQFYGALGAGQTATEALVQAQRSQAVRTAPGEAAAWQYVQLYRFE